MEKLQEKDPEFYKFLKENDKELLEFNDSDTGSEMEGSNDGDGDMDEDYDEENEEDVLSEHDSEFEDVHPDILEYAGSAPKASWAVGPCHEGME